MFDVPDAADASMEKLALKDQRRSLNKRIKKSSMKLDLFHFCDARLLGFKRCDRANHSALLL